VSSSIKNLRPYGRCFVLTSGLMIIACGSLQANGVQVGGTIIGLFSSPVFSGYVANDPSLGQATFLDNTGTATVSINNSSNPTLGGTPPQQLTGSALTWGSSATAPGFSVLTFFGAPIPMDFSHQFQLGTITFLNGTSDLTSLIFGATLSFYDNFVSPQTFLGSDQVIITTTSNLGQDPTQDSDYINICGPMSNICGKSIQAVESTQGGNGVTVNLLGTIVGDPMLFVNDVTLAPGQTTNGNGSIGSQAAIGITPEPATFGLMAPLLGLGFLVHRRKRAA
jgi:hypothetical protein